MKEQVNEMIDLAMPLLETWVTKNTLREVHAAYINALSPNISIMNFIPALAVYEADRYKKNERKSEEDRSIALDWIWDIMKKKSNYESINHEHLFEYCINNQNNDALMDQIEEDVLNILIALKLCIRTFNY